MKKLMGEIVFRAPPQPPLPSRSVAAAGTTSFAAPRYRKPPEPTCIKDGCSVQRCISRQAMQRMHGEPGALPGQASEAQQSSAAQGTPQESRPEKSFVDLMRPRHRPSPSLGGSRTELPKSQSKFAWGPERIGHELVIKFDQLSRRSDDHTRKLLRAIGTDPYFQGYAGQAPPSSLQPQQPTQPPQSPQSQPERDSGRPQRSYLQPTASSRCVSPSRRKTWGGSANASDFAALRSTHAKYSRRTDCPMMAVLCSNCRRAFLRRGPTRET